MSIHAPLAACVALLIVASGVFAENDVLPDGTVFTSWEVPRDYTRTYHVAQSHPRASDASPGARDRPWLTIGKAAQVLQPGERVIVHKGVYREWVQPERGGEAPDGMVWYQAARGEEVVLKGSDPWTPTWERLSGAEGEAPTWRAALTDDLFTGEKLFQLENFPEQSEGDWKRFPSMELRRGQLFLDGDPLSQVATREELLQTENAFWVESDGQALQVRLTRDESPAGNTLEITTREQVFAPVKRGLNYIGVSGFRILHAGNAVPIPPPQRGALSATAGNHWIIEDCEIAFANTLGIDLGGQWWTLPGNDRQGWHIVRRNHVHHCGVAGICGWHNRANQSCLLEDNLVTDNGWMPITHHFETAGVKIHYTVDCLFRRNVLLRNRNSAALWFDGFSTNTRITQNVFCDTEGSPFGSIFLEITQGPNLVDNNLIVGSSNHGIYEHDAARLIVLQNLIANGTGSAVYLNRGDPNRKFNDTHAEEEHRVYGNLLCGSDTYVVFPTDTSRSDYNVLGGFSGDGEQPFSVQTADQCDLAAWREQGNDRHSVELPLEVSFDPERLELRVKGPTGARLPTYEPFALTPGIPPLKELLPADFVWPLDPKLGAEYAPLPTLLQADLVGRSRNPRRFGVGPLVGLRLDGSPIRVDPRRK